LCRRIVGMSTIVAVIEAIDISRVKPAARLDSESGM
jgi:hypothetical protein